MHVVAYLTYCSVETQALTLMSDSKDIMTALGTPSHWFNMP